MIYLWHLAGATHWGYSYGNGYGSGYGYGDGGDYGYTN